jgi:hypothetical protein
VTRHRVPLGIVLAAPVVGYALFIVMRLILQPRWN